MADSEICGTKDPTFHRILLDTRFELPLGELGGGRARAQENRQTCVGPDNPHSEDKVFPQKTKEFPGCQRVS